MKNGRLGGYYAEKEKKLVLFIYKWDRKSGESYPASIFLVHGLVWDRPGAVLYFWDNGDVCHVSGGRRKRKWLS